MTLLGSSCLSFLKSERNCSRQRLSLPSHQCSLEGLELFLLLLWNISARSRKALLRLLHSAENTKSSEKGASGAHTFWFWVVIPLLLSPPMPQHLCFLLLRFRTHHWLGELGEMVQRLSLLSPLAVLPQSQLLLHTTLWAFCGRQLASFIPLGKTLMNNCVERHNDDWQSPKDRRKPRAAQCRLIMRQHWHHTPDFFIQPPSHHPHLSEFKDSY